jgi:proteic killer suppression protein
MEITFEKEYLLELYETGKTTDKKYRFQPQVAVKYRKTIDILESVSSIEDLYKFNALHYEALHGK